MKCILQIKWHHQFIQNDEITESTINLRVNQPSPQFSLWSRCQRTFQLTRYSTATFTYHSDVHQVANGVVA